MRGVTSALVLLLGGCSMDLDIFPDTRAAGEYGVLRFSYAPAAAFDCLLAACPIDRPLATEAQARVVVHGADPARPLVARTSSRRVDVEELVAGHACEGDADFRPVDAGEPCARGEVRVVTYVATLRAHAPGGFALELRDGAGRLVDSLAMSAEDPAAATLAGAPGGRVALSAGETRALELSLSSAAGPLALHDGVTWTFADPSVARAGHPLEDLFGAPTDLVVHGQKAGVTSVTLRVGAFERSFPVDVGAP